MMTVIVVVFIEKLNENLGRLINLQRFSEFEMTGDLTNIMNFSMVILKGYYLRFTTLIYVS